MVTPSEICSLALNHIGQTNTNISNLQTDTSSTARTCRVHWDIARRFVLSDYDWSFARRKVYLSLAGDAPRLYQYRYHTPADMLQFRGIVGDRRTDPPIKFELVMSENQSSQEVYTDREGAEGIYTVDVTNTAQFSAGFVSALAWYLGAQLALAIPKDLKKFEACLKAYMMVRDSAEIQDAGQSTSEEADAAPWDEVR